MNPGGEDPRWRQQRSQQSTQQRSQGGGQRRNNPGGNTNSNGNNAWQGQNQQQQQQIPQVYVEPHIPVRGFNGKEVEDFLYRAYQKELDAAKNQGIDQSQKPTIYKSDKGWSLPTKGGAWGNRSNTMASGNHFLNQLRRSQVAFQSNPKE